MASAEIAFWVVALLVVLALLFDFMNGFHDAANAIAKISTPEEFARLSAAVPASRPSALNILDMAECSVRKGNPSGELRSALTPLLFGQQEEWSEVWG